MLRQVRSSPQTRQDAQDSAHWEDPDDRRQAQGKVHPAREAPGTGAQASRIKVGFGETGEAHASGLALTKSDWPGASVLGEGNRDIALAIGIVSG